MGAEVERAGMEIYLIPTAQQAYKPSILAIHLLDQSHRLEPPRLRPLALHLLLSLVPSAGSSVASGPSVDSSPPPCQSSSSVRSLSTSWRTDSVSESDGAAARKLLRSFRASE